MRRGAVFNGQPLPALAPPSWISPLAPGARGRLLRALIHVPALHRARSAFPCAARGQRSEWRCGDPTLAPARLRWPQGCRNALRASQPLPVCVSPGGKPVRRVAGTEGHRGRPGVRVRGSVCVRARVLVCARWGRRWRPLRPGSAPAREGLQGLAPPELGICRRSLSIFVQS